MKYVRKAVVLFCLLALSMGVSHADELKNPKLQTTCPIMGLKINKKLFVDAAGQRIYVCCKGCIPVVKKDPEKALSKLAAKGEFAETRQTLCPMMKSEINKKLYVDYKGRRLYACCPPCVTAFKKDPAKFAKQITELVEKKGKALKKQTRCPIMGGAINKKLYVDVKGKRVYICCPGCTTPIKKNPEAAFKKLTEWGEEAEDVK
ncbi:MAG: hypothetical protein ACYTGH_10860 [Planctomycetota bacterium]|jgi:YHS domain-containing protein